MAPLTTYNHVLGIIVLDISFKKNASSSFKYFGFQSTFFEDGLQEFNNEVARGFCLEK